MFANCVNCDFCYIQSVFITRVYLWIIFHQNSYTFTPQITSFNKCSCRHVAFNMHYRLNRKKCKLLLSY